MKKASEHKAYEPLLMGIAILSSLPIFLYFQSQPNANVSDATGKAKLAGIILIFLLYFIFEGISRIIKMKGNKRRIYNKRKKR